MCFLVVSIYNLKMLEKIETLSPNLLSFVVARMCSTIDSGERGTRCLDKFCLIFWLYFLHCTGGLCVYFMTDAPECSTKSCSRKAGDRTCAPWFTRHNAYHLVHTTAASIEHKFLARERIVSRRRFFYALKFYVVIDGGKMKKIVQL